MRPLPVAPKKKRLRKAKVHWLKLQLVTEGKILVSLAILVANLERIKCRLSLVLGAESPLMKINRCWGLRALEWLKELSLMRLLLLNRFKSSQRLALFSHPRIKLLPKWHKPNKMIGSALFKQMFLLYKKSQNIPHHYPATLNLWKMQT